MSRRSQRTTEQAESPAPFISPKLGRQGPLAGLSASKKGADIKSILVQPPMAEPSAVSNHDTRNIGNSNSLSASKDNRETGYDQALYYAFHAKFGLPLEQGPKGLLPRPKSVNGVRMWDLGDRNRDLYLVTIIVNKDKFMMATEVNCGDLDREVSDAVNNPAKLVERLRGVIFWYTMRKKAASDKKPGSIFEGSGSRAREANSDIRGFVTKDEQARLIANVGIFYAPKIVQDASIVLAPEFMECSDLDYFYPVEGTVLRIFKYHGKVCYSTTSYINCDFSRHLFCPNYKKIYEELGGPDADDLFGSVDTSKYVYLFKIVHPATGQCSSNAFKQCLLYEGMDIANVESSPSDRMWPKAKYINTRYYIDLIQSTNSESGSVIKGPVKLSALSEDDVTKIYTDAISAKDDVDYLIGVPVQESGKSDVVLKFITPKYLMATTARGNTQNVLRNMIDLVALTNYSFISVETENGKVVFRRHDHVEDGEHIVEYSFGGQVMFRESYRVVGGSKGVIQVDPEFSWLSTTGIAIDYADTYHAGQNSELPKQFFYGTLYTEAGRPEGAQNQEGYLDGMVAARPNDWFRYARNVMYNNINKGRRAALITYTDILKDALKKMHNAGMGLSSWEGGAFVQKRFNPSTFGKRRLRYPQASASDSGYSLVPRYPGTNTLYDAEMYLDINNTLSSYQKEKVAEAKSEIKAESSNYAAALAGGGSRKSKKAAHAENSYAAAAAKGAAKGRKQPSATQIEESKPAEVISKYEVLTSITKEEYDLFVKNYKARMSPFEKLVPEPTVNLPLLYIRWTVTDSERIAGKAFRTNGEYKFAKRILEYFLECPI